MCVAGLVATIRKIYMFSESSVFLLNNQYNNVTTAVQGPGIVSACYPGACSEFHIGSFGVGCTMRENNLGGNCSSCSPGMYLPARTTYSTCLACLPGKHAPNLGMAECTTCSAGRYQDAMQGDVCKTCPNGKYSNNSIACIKVPPGSYPTNCFSDDRGCANTELCPEGLFCNGTTPKPLPCPPGQTTEFRGMASCSKCSVGKKGTGNGCQSCPGNSIANSPGRTTCEECKQGRYATSEKTFCARVVERGNAPIVQLVSANGNRLMVVWNAEDFSTGNATLIVTDKETEKDKRSRYIGLISPILLAPLPLASRVYQVHIQVRYANASSPVSSPVYKGAKWKITSDCTDLQYLQNGDKDMTKWKCRKCPPGASCAGPITQDGIKARFGWWRESKSSKAFFRCLKPSACLGAPNPNLETQFPDARKDNNESCQLKTYKPSRLCAACQAGYARGNGDGSCNRCTNGFWNAVEFVVAVVVGTLFLLFLVRVTVFKPRVVRLSDGIKKIGLSYLQLATLAMHVDVPWTEELQNLFSWQSYSSNVSEAVLSVDCLFGWSAFDAFRLKFVATMVSPLVIVACSYLGIRAVHGSRSQFYATVILLWYLVFPSVVSKVATLFTCIPLGEVSYLVLDPEVVCWEGQHMSLSVFGIVATIVYVLGMPVSGFLVCAGRIDLA